MKLLMLGVSLATLAVTTIPAQAGRYVVDQCSPNQGREKWFLIFDTQTSTANFSKAGSDKPRYGSYTMSDGITYTNVTNDTAAPMDLKLRPNHDPDGKPVLEWTSGGEESTMLCDFLYEKDYTPANWVALPGAPVETPPQEAYNPPTVPAPGYTCTGSDGVMRACDTQQVIPPNTTASVPPDYVPLAPYFPLDPSDSTSGLIIPLIPDGIGGHKLDVTLGINTPVTMLLDTGATMVSLPKDIADQLVSVGDATIIGTMQFTIADGTTSTQNVIDIGKFTIGGRTIYHVHAGCGVIGSPLLLGTNVLNRFGKYSVDPVKNQLILG